MLKNGGQKTRPKTCRRARPTEGTSNDLSCLLPAHDKMIRSETKCKAEGEWLHVLLLLGLEDGFVDVLALEPLHLLLDVHKVQRAPALSPAKLPVVVVKDRLAVSGEREREERESGSQAAVVKPGSGT